VRIERTPVGVLIHSPLEYDLRWLVRSRGRERAFRRHLLDLGRVAEGDAVLDVGCATGTLALAAAPRVGRSGTVHGVDPSPGLVARARAKARRGRRANVAFDVATAQELPFADRSFDVVLCTLVAHQLPHADRRTCFAQMHRVLKPRGRLLLVDLALSRRPADRATPHGHGHFDVADLVPLLSETGFAVVARGPVVFPLRRFDPLGYVLAAA
jgi:ubiquinone/menaquinone biosynthesis C-methylase UbiE